MKLLINGEERELNLPADSSFPQLMEEVYLSSQAPDTAVTRVMLNKQNITGKDWEEYNSLTLADINTLEVETSSVKILALETIGSLRDFIQTLSIDLERAGELFRLGDQLQANDLYSRLLDGIQLIHHMTTLIERNIDLDLSGVNFKEIPISHHLKKLSPIIEDMLAAQQEEDWILLADLIEYELIPHFQDRREMLDIWEEAAGN